MLRNDSHLFLYIFSFLNLLSCFSFYLLWYCSVLESLVLWQEFLCCSSSGDCSWGRMVSETLDCHPASLSCWRIRKVHLCGCSDYRLARNLGSLRIGSTIGWGLFTTPILSTVTLMAVPLVISESLCFYNFFQIFKGFHIIPFSFKQLFCCSEGLLIHLICLFNTYCVFVLGPRDIRIIKEMCLQ